MTARCPICGAPMEGYVCGYCGYRSVSAEEEREKAKARARREARQERRERTAERREEREGAYRSAAVSVKSRWLAFILCFFFGKLGIHRFYAGKIGTGLLWLFTWGFFGIGWLVDLICIAAGTFEDGSGLPLYR